MVKTLFLIAVLTVFVCSAVIKLPPSIRKKIQDLFSKTQSSFLYHGTMDIQIISGDQQNLDFFVRFVPETQCNWTKCFTGWVVNYTLKGQQKIQGYPNGNLTVNPIFSFNTNSQADFQIIRSHQLQLVWSQIIDLSCQKLNPQLVKNSSITATRSIDKYLPEYAPKYVFTDPTLTGKSFISSDTRFSATQNFSSFSKNDNFTILSAQRGDLQATSSQQIALKGFDFQNSIFQEQILLNKDLLVKQRLINYDFSINSDNTKSSQEGIVIPDLSGKVLIGLNLAETPNVLVLQVSNAKLDLASLSAANDSFNYQDIQNQRRNIQVSSYPIDPVIQTKPDAKNFTNQKYVGPQTLKTNLNNKADTFTTADTSVPINPALSFSSAVRRLQYVVTEVLYDQTQLLYSKTIFGHVYQAYFKLNCNLWEDNASNDNARMIQCTGIVKMVYFNQIKQIVIFDFYKQVFDYWSYQTQFSGNWGFSVYIPLPPPVSMLGVRLTLNLGYVIPLKIIQSFNKIQVSYPVISAIGFDLQAIVSAVVTTSASGSMVFCGVLEGGVFITGTLVALTTDPSISLYYLHIAGNINWLTQTQTPQTRQIQIHALWNFQILAFQFQWGFFYRKRKLFHGWGQNHIIASWPINEIHKYYNLVDKNWAVNY